jgi:hypothetical protein
MFQCGVNISYGGAWIKVGTNWGKLTMDKSYSNLDKVPNPPNYAYPYSDQIRIGSCPIKTT